MPYVITRTKLKDFATWKSAFSSPEGKANRKAAGAKWWQVFRSKDNPNTVMILFEWDNLDNARKYYQDPKWREMQPQIGVIEEPNIHFLEEVEKECTCD